MPCSSASTCGCGTGQGILLPVLSCRLKLSALGVGKVLRGKFLLCFYQAFYLRTELLEELVVAFGYRTGDNQRSTGVVNQYGVYLIDDGVIVLALYQVFRADSHVIAQIVETEFVVVPKVISAR